MARAARASKQADPEEDLFTPFLTAFDPSDLPGSSVDPLGFDRGYNLLADKILPGITNVGRRPRYFSLLCAGIVLADDNGKNLPERIQYEQRLQTLLRLERLWVLATLLASDDVTLSSQAGIRGALYGKAQLDRLKARGANRTGTDFELLVRQVPYGVVGIYGNVANGMRLFDRKSLTLTPALGERLGRAFLDETDIPTPVLKAARDPSAEVALSTLREWGERAHLEVPTGPVEADCLGEALHTDPTRSRMALLLAEHPAQEEDWEQSRLSRILEAIQADEQNRDLAEAIAAILKFENCFRWTLLAFERLLWNAKGSEIHSVPVSDCVRDPVLIQAAEAFPAVVSAFERSLESGHAEAFRRDQQRLSDLRAFLTLAAERANRGDVLGFIETIVDRHGQVQRGKFDKGRPKLPWIERKGASFELTLARVGEISHEPVSMDDVTAHEYRVASADALITASRGARP